MKTYYITFRLEQDATYNDRWKRLVDAIDGISTRWWVEPTSFFLFESGHSIDQVAAVAKAAINVNKDVVLVGMVDYKGARVVGKANSRAVFDLMPEARAA